MEAFGVMDNRLKKVLTGMKKHITSNISNVKELLMHHGQVLSEGEIQKIECDLDRHGLQWALNTFVDCIKCRGKQGFKEFMNFLQENNYDELLQIFEEECQRFDLFLGDYVQSRRNSSTSSSNPGRHSFTSSSDSGYPHSELTGKCFTLPLKFTMSDLCGN